MELQIYGFRVSTDGKVKIQSTKAGDLYVAQGLPAGTVATLSGAGYQAMATAAIAALVVRPSTTAAFTLWNGESAGGKSYVIERVMCHQLVSTAAQARFGIWLCSHPIGMAAVTADITAIKSTSGKSAYGGSARLDNGATVADDGWFPWGDSVDVEPTGVLPGAQISAEVNGRIIVPPTAGLSAHVVASLVGDTFTLGFHWYELQLDVAYEYYIGSNQSVGLYSQLGLCGVKIKGG